jgi:hypothetical protein
MVVLLPLLPSLLLLRLLAASVPLDGTELPSHVCGTPAAAAAAAQVPVAGLAQG